MIVGDKGYGKSTLALLLAKELKGKICYTKKEFLENVELLNKGDNIFFDDLGIYYKRELRLKND